MRLLVIDTLPSLSPHLFVPYPNLEPSLTKIGIVLIEQDRAAVSKIGSLLA